MSSSSEDEFCKAMRSLPKTESGSHHSAAVQSAPLQPQPKAPKAPSQPQPASMASTMKSMLPVATPCRSRIRSNVPVLSQACVDGTEKRVLMDDDKNRVKVWSDHIMRPLEGLRAARGELQTSKLAVLYSGCGSAHAVWDLCGLSYEIEFCVDAKNVAYNFSQANFKAPKHFFVEARDLLHDLTGRCVQCGDGWSTARICKVSLEKGELGHGQCSASCCPYSKARAERGVSTEHKDLDLVELWFTMLRESDPRTGLFEQVAGFGMPSRKGSPRTPLQDFIERMAIEFPHFICTCYFLDGQTFLGVRRHRIWVSVINLKYSTEQSDLAMRQIVKASN